MLASLASARTASSAPRRSRRTRAAAWATARSRGTWRARAARRSPRPPAGTTYLLDPTPCGGQLGTANERDAARSGAEVTTRTFALFDATETGCPRRSSRGQARIRSVSSARRAPSPSLVSNQCLVHWQRAASASDARSTQGPAASPRTRAAPFLRERPEAEPDAGSDAAASRRAASSEVQEGAHALRCSLSAASRPRALTACMQHGETNAPASGPEASC